MSHINLNRYREIIQELKSQDVELVAVSKTKPIEAIEELFQLGQKDFGENKVQELIEKHNKVSTEIRWHLIGHLQSNKVKYIAPFIYMIHSVDSIKLVQEIQKRAVENNRIIKILIQIHIAEEESKFGIPPSQFQNFYDSFKVISTSNIEVCGLMGMATFTDNAAQVKKEFEVLSEMFSRLRSDNFFGKEFSIMSIGMSDDYKIAIDVGGNMVRIGSALFGARE